MLAPLGLGSAHSSPTLSICTCVQLHSTYSMHSGVCPCIAAPGHLLAAHEHTPPPCSRCGVEYTMYGTSISLACGPQMQMSGALYHHRQFSLGCLLRPKRMECVSQAVGALYVPVAKSHLQLSFAQPDGDQHSLPQTIDRRAFCRLESVARFYDPVVA